MRYPLEAWTKAPSASGWFIRTSPDQICREAAFAAVHLFVLRQLNPIAKSILGKPEAEPGQITEKTSSPIFAEGGWAR